MSRKVVQAQRWRVRVRRAYTGALEILTRTVAFGGRLGLVFLKVSTTREKVSEGEERMQEGPSAVV